ncbi:hypothetical protein C0Q70_06623 [Pomacea canaliculata]|uniref:Uncharacterized protein n=1 Tax=Pomacea canaliculata TaxID=400727 RepID=A0A2T7PCR8_POMCA|nr:hypothetical protein C0Q70_06623 [Pomacea canaliculata]
MELSAIVLSCLAAIILCIIKLPHVLVVDAVYTVLGGACTLWYTADVLNEYSRGIVLDIHHIFLAKIRVVNLLTTTVSWLLIRKSVDITTRSAVSFSRFITYAISAIVMIMAHGTNSFTRAHLAYSTIPTTLWAVVLGMQMFKTGTRVNAHIRTSDINLFLVVDMFLHLVLGLADIIHPFVIADIQDLELDDLHVYQYRLNGAVSLGNAAFSWVARRFRFGDEKRAVILSHFLSCVVILAGMTTWLSSGMLTFTFSTQIIYLRNVLIMLPAVICFLRKDNGAFWFQHIFQHFAKKGREKLPPRPPGQRSEPEGSGAFHNFGFGGDGGFQFSFGIGAFPFGIFASAFNFNDGRPAPPPQGSPQEAEEQFLSKVFLWVAIIFIFWLLIA